MQGFNILGLHKFINMMSISSIKKIFLFLFIIAFVACSQKSPAPLSKDNSENEKACRQVLKTLLKSIEEQDLEALKSTMSPNGKLEFILDSREPSFTTDAFVDLHVAWFQDATWTMETKIISITVDDVLATATTEAMYREPDRNGKPYYNRMIVSYILEKIEGKWYVTKDQANSIEKTPS